MAAGTLFARQQIAALAGLGVLGERKQARKQLLAFDCFAAGIAVGNLRFGEDCARADDQRDNGKASKERKRLPSQGASQSDDHCFVGPEETVEFSKW